MMPHIRNIAIVVFIAGACGLCGPCSFAEEPDDIAAGDAHIDWQVIEGSFVTIYIDPDIDPRGAARMLDVDFARQDPVERDLFLNKGISDTERLLNKTEIIFRRARKVLNMFPANLHVTVKIYADRKELQRRYHDIFAEWEDYKSFYIFKYNTVYISGKTLDSHILAHEFGHAISDHYFIVQPPPKIKELLAGYVDLHLED